VKDMSSVEEKLEKYLGSLGEVLEEVRLREGATQAHRLLDLARRYYMDALHYRDRDPLTALVCVVYSEGLLDALRFLGLASFQWPFERRGARHG